MKASLTEIADRVKSALNNAQDEYENSPMFGEDGNYDQGYIAGIWRAYDILLTEMIESFKEVKHD